MLKDAQIHKKSNEHQDGMAKALLLSPCHKKPSVTESKQSSFTYNVIKG
jgi:hypothetical protein